MKRIIQTLGIGAIILALIFHFGFNRTENHIYLYAEIACWISAVILEQIAKRKKPLDLMGSILFVFGILMYTLTNHQILPHNPVTISLYILPLAVGLLLMALGKDEFAKYFVTYLLPIVLGIAAIFICLFGITADPVNSYVLALGIFFWICCILSVFILIKKERVR